MRAGRRRRLEGRPRRLRPATVGPALLVALLATQPAAHAATDPADVFRSNCASCHTIGGGRLTGPDLKDVTDRQDRDWLVRFIQNPKSVIDRGDPYAQRLVRESRGVVMPTLPGMRRELAESLLDLIETESALEESQFAGTRIPDRPFTPEDVALGHRLFTGRAPLARSGAACVACHTVNGVGGLGGGRLGPDLSLVFERMQGRAALGAWLMAPPTPTMQSVFKEHPLQPDEIFALIAYFEDAARRGGEDRTVGLMNFLMIGLGGGALGLASFGAVWKRRFYSARRSLLLGRGGRERR